MDKYAWQGSGPYQELRQNSTCAMVGGLVLEQMVIGLVYVMSDNDKEFNEYADLPDDPELAFAVLQQRKYADLSRLMKDEEDPGWHLLQGYIDTLVAFDEVYELGIFHAYKDQLDDQDVFPSIYHELRRHVEFVSQKFKIEAARRARASTSIQSMIVLDTGAREAIHTLINSIGKKLNELCLSEDKRDSLFNKLNAFASEVDPNRTRPEAFFSFVVDLGRTLRKVKGEANPLQDGIDRVLDFIDKAEKWSDRKRIAGPPKRITPPRVDSDDEIPF